MGTVFESGKVKAAKGEGWAPPLSSAVLKIQLVSEQPLPLRQLGYEKMLLLPPIIPILYLSSYVKSND